MVTQDTMNIIRSYWHTREEYWYRRISDINFSILFICGHEHVERFKSLLLGKRHQCKIIDIFWKAYLFKDYGSLNLA